MKQLSLFSRSIPDRLCRRPHAPPNRRSAAEESYTAPAQKAEHDPDARPPLEPTLPSPKPASPEASPPDASSPESPTLAETEEALPSQRVVDPSRPMVALTFDDGPHAEYTDQILDILEEHQTVATFFEVAVNLHRDPDAVRRAVDMGCEIGSHSYRHADLGKMSQEAIQADLAAADELFTQVLGQAPTLLRPPYGSINQALKTSSGRALVTWSIDTEDWLNRNTEKIVSSVQNFGDLDGPGDSAPQHLRYHRGGHPDSGALAAGAGISAGDGQRIADAPLPAGGPSQSPLRVQSFPLAGTAAGRDSRHSGGPGGPVGGARSPRRP